jgi:hypothetical protein
MKTYTVLYAEDVPHYCTVDVQASTPEKALRKARRYTARHDLNFQDPDWENPVCLRIVHIEDEDGGIVARDIPLDDFRLERASHRRASDDGLVSALRMLREAIGGLPITILNGPFYDALHAADKALGKEGAA